MANPEIIIPDFANFYLTDINSQTNVYEMANGLIPEIAERLDFELSSEPNSQEMYEMVGEIGPDKQLRNNPDVAAIDRNLAITFVEQSGVQRPLNRSLWTP